MIAEVECLIEKLDRSLLADPSVAHALDHGGLVLMEVLARDDNVSSLNTQVTFHRRSVFVIKKHLRLIYIGNIRNRRNRLTVRMTLL